ncbi:unnamed protein product [Urochloa humidicola]
MKFDFPTCNVGYGYLGFMLFAGGDSGRKDKVLISEQTRRALLYDPESPSIRSLPSLTAPKSSPASLTIGNNLYILDTNIAQNYHRNHCFEGYLYDGDWYCHSLAQPPYIHANRNSSSPISYEDVVHVNSYAIVGGSNIWISQRTLGTHSFDTTRHIWTKVGDWVLPFSGHVQYVPEHNLWFGLSSGGSEIEHDSSICASDLTELPPKSVNIWRDVTPPQWINMSSYLLHLGHSRFCHVKFFEISRPYDDLRSYAVFTGIEVECRGEDGGELGVVKHRSEQYRLLNKDQHWIL